MKKILFMLVLLASLAVCSCGGKKNIDELLAMPASEMTESDAEQLAAYFEDFADKFQKEAGLDPKDKEGAEKLLKYMEEHREDIVKASSALSKLQSLPMSLRDVPAVENALKVGLELNSKSIPSPDSFDPSRAMDAAADAIDAAADAMDAAADAMDIDPSDIMDMNDMDPGDLDEADADKD